MGKTTVKEFVQVRLVKREVQFHDNVKQHKLKTFETLYSVPVSLPNDEAVTSKADRDLLRRVIDALESDREVDVDTLLQRELSPVPLSIVTFDGSLRLASSKSDFVNITQKNVHQSQPPSATIRRALLSKVWKIPQVQRLSESGVIISLRLLFHTFRTNAQ